MYDYRLPCVSLGLIIYLQTTFSRNCDLEFTDVPSKTYKADFVVEGMVHRIISLGGNGAGKGSKKESVVRFRVSDVLKGTLDKETNSSRQQTINVGRFGAKADPGRCIAPLPQIGSRYVLFLRSSADTNNGTRMEKGEGDFLRPDFFLSSFPALFSDEVIFSVRQSTDNSFARKPSVRMLMKDRTLEPEEVARVQCIASGRPRPKVIWFKDNVQIRRTKRVSFFDSKRGSTLVIRHLTPTDSGNYRCQAINVVGNSSLHSIKGVLVTVVGLSPTTTESVKDLHTRPCDDMEGYCFHGGVCRYIIALKRTHCVCPTGFRGDRCEEKVLIYGSLVESEKVASVASMSPHTNPCEEMDNYCGNGGTCLYVKDLNKRLCQCPRGYVGVRCLEKFPGGLLRVLSVDGRDTSVMKQLLLLQPYAM